MQARYCNAVVDLLRLLTPDCVRCSSLSFPLRSYLYYVRPTADSCWKSGFLPQLISHNCTTHLVSMGSCISQCAATKSRPVHQQKRGNVHIVATPRSKSMPRRNSLSKSKRIKRNSASGRPARSPSLRRHSMEVVTWSELERRSSSMRKRKHSAAAAAYLASGRTPSGRIPRS